MYTELEGAFQGSVIQKSHVSLLNYLALQLLQLSFEETAVARWFPELQDLPSSVTYMDMRVVGDQRLTALGCQSGQLMCAVTNIISCGMISSGIQ